MPDRDDAGPSRPRIRIASRELAVLRREKTIVLALAIQLFIAAFSSFLVVGLVSLYDPGSLDGYEIEVAVTGETVDELIAAADQVDGISARAYDDPASARRAFDAGVVDATLATQRREGRIQVTALAPDGSVESTLVVTQLQETLRALERDERVRNGAHLERQPLPLPDPPTGSPYYGFTYTVLLPLLLFLPVFISGSLIVDSVTEELDRGTLELLRVAPVTTAEIVDGKSLAAAGLAPAQAALWILLLWANDTPVANPGTLLVLVAAFATAVVAMGIGLAVLAPRRRDAQFLYSVGVLALFAGATLLPGSPINAAALLAVDSATATTKFLVGGYAVVAAIGYLGVRTAIQRVGFE
ncbi:MAG: ABC transporter permease [Haloferacaceae archaeon]